MQNKANCIKVEKKYKFVKSNVNLSKTKNWLKSEGIKIEVRILLQTKMNSINSDRDRSEKCLNFIVVPQVKTKTRESGLRGKN